MLSGRHLPLQTLAIVSMNALDWWRARDLLLAPREMLCANAWVAALG